MERKRGEEGVRVGRKGREVRRECQVLRHIGVQGRGGDEQGGG